MSLRSRLRRTFDRLLIRLLSRQRGPAQAIRDVAYVREIIRFGLVFGGFVLLPMFVLAGLALGALEAEELGVDAGLARRGEALGERVHDGLRGLITACERRLPSAVEQGEAGVDRLHASCPGLRGVFRLDASGQLGFPFVWPDEPWAEPPTAWDRAMREAGEHERAERWPEAAAATTRALAAARDPQHVAVARFIAARVAVRAGSPGGLDQLVQVAARASTLRDPHGFRVADLAQVLRAEQLRERDRPEEATALLRGVVEGALASPWPLGNPAEGIVARQALRLLEGVVDKRWWQAADVELDRRLERAWWAGVVTDELRLVASRPAPAGRNLFSSSSRALWAVDAVGSSTWLLSFDADALQEELGRTVVNTANAVEPDLTVVLMRSDDEAVSALTRRSLAPELPDVSVVVRPADPEALARQRLITRWQRRGVITLAVVAALLGLTGAAQMVNRELDTARLKSDFAANVSHELRSPLTQIRLKAESLQLDLVDDEADRRAHYDAIVREVERLSRLVDNVLDFAAIERGQKKYTLRPADLGEVLRATASIFQPNAVAKGFEFVVDVPDDLPMVWIDRDAMGQVVTNLISNALKYGSEGRYARVTAWHEAEAVSFSVEDRGIGIAPADLARVFEHFYRVDSAEVRKRRGTGIGLTIVRYIVEAHRGTITADSKVGQGTTFTVSLPTSPAPDDGGA